LSTPIFNYPWNVIFKQKQAVKGQDIPLDKPHHYAMLARQVVHNNEQTNIQRPADLERFVDDHLLLGG
jgi:hypothetical protein